MVAKRRRRLDFWRRAAFEFPDDPERPSDDQNRFFSSISRENFENFSKKFQKISRSLVSDKGMESTVNTSGVLEGTEVREGYRKFGSRVYGSSGGGTEVRESSFLKSFQKICP